MTKAVSIAQSGSNNVTMRNRIINGAMMIDQRNAGASVSTTNVGNITYTVDRWAYIVAQASKFTIQQNAGSVTPPAGFTNYLGVTSTSAYSITSTDYFGISQSIEGLNIPDLAWGTANAAAVTLSFWVRSSLTGVFGGSVRNSAANRSYPFSYTINSANTWEQKIITIAGDTSGTWLTTNGVGAYVQFSLGVGSTYSGTAGAWAAGNYTTATGATSVVGTSGATLYITGVQLEAGTTATPFEQRLYGTELALCQRYYEFGNYSQFSGYVVSGSIYYSAYVSFAVTKRAAPTGTLTNAAAAGFPAVSGAFGDNTVNGFDEPRTANATTNAGYFYSTWTASAEL